ncbi:uncharacterized protein LOC110976767 [Acanthaster planci]|uniref:Uncharacterized protein LOC110976767 n=1 Tax=Acanthaster planci TaxID=133434 RepID=A0A8B7XYQ3_ACAPL|nr:uncharacterized protein LOC110976767 [Acanthaster planci]
MLSAKVLILLFLTIQAKGFWDDGSQDPTYSHLGLYQKNLTCNDAGTTCQLCYVATARGRRYLHVIQYSVEPYNLAYHSFSGYVGSKSSFVQDDPSQTFRFCVDGPADERATWKVLFCLDNDFSAAMPLPPTCSQPVAFVSLLARFSDEEMAGQQILACIP